MAAATAERTSNLGPSIITFDSDEIGVTVDGVKVTASIEEEAVETDEGGTEDYYIKDVKVTVDLITQNWNLDAFAKILGVKIATLTDSGADAKIAVGLANNAEIGVLASSRAKAMTVVPASGAATPKYSFTKAAFTGAFEIPQSGRKPSQIALRFNVLRSSGVFFTFGKTA